MPGGCQLPHAGEYNYTGRSGGGYAVYTGQYIRSIEYIYHPLSHYQSHLFMSCIAVRGICVLLLSGQLNKEGM